MKVTKLGHASLVIEIGNARFLTDPWLVDPVMNVIIHRESVPKGSLPKFDAILATHAHEDHFDPKTVQQVAEGVPVYCPRECEREVRKAGAKEIHGLATWDRTHVKNVTIVAAPARHEGGEIGFILIGPEAIVYFAGDTARDDRIFRLSERFAIDLAIIPISGTYAPLVETHQLSARAAAETCRMLKPRFVLPIDEGAAIKARFTPDQAMRVDPPTKEFKDALKKACPHAELVDLAAGDAWEYA